IERATYLIGPDGKILEIWRKVRVKDHVSKVLDAVKTHNA
ncbi:MAG: peroxiredoxin, partial [Litorimonas sp.]